MKGMYMSYMIKIDNSYENVILSTTVDVDPTVIYKEDMVYSDGVCAMNLDKDECLVYAKLQLDEYRKCGVNAKLIDKVNNNIIKEV